VFAYRVPWKGASIVGRTVGRIGGAVAGIIAIIFGILDVQDKVPPWLLVTLGALAIVGVILDYLWEYRGAGEQSPGKVKQKQRGGKESTNNQAGRDININQPPPGKDKQSP